jgi:hypothetical protein
MSGAQLKKSTRDHAVKIIKENLRDELNLAMPEVDLDPEDTVKWLKSIYNLDTKEAGQTFAYIVNDIKSRRTFTRVEGVPGKPYIYSPTLSKAKNKYDAVSSWKRQIGKKLEKKHGMKGFSTQFHLGHGKASVPAVGYRAIKAAKYLGGKEGAESMIGFIMTSELIKGYQYDGNIESVLTKKGKFKKVYTVRLKLQAASENLAQAAGEKLLNKKLIEEFERQAVMEETSKSSINAIAGFVDDALRDNKKAKGFREASKASITWKNPKKRKTTKKPQRLRTSSGQFTSAMNIQAILNAKIKEEVADNMGKGGALVYRTGRFASSVSVEKVMQSRQGALTAYYTYMKAPYQTFERGFAQGSFRRDPRKLIAASIREIARETLSHKLGIRTRRV